jgi:hypothetical protein
MKFVEPNPFTDPDATARKLLEIANATEPAQDGRIYIELVNAAFLKAGGTAEQFRPRLFPKGAQPLGYISASQSQPAPANDSEISSDHR